tara:strand:- start:2260 stop:2568 length:309 start_codon:yes stop_codon:yes gene_type:complete
VDKEEVKVTILDRQFSVSCKEGEKELLLEAATFLDDQIRVVQEQTKLVGLDRCAIIAALNITNELLALKKGDSALSLAAQRIQSIGERIEETIKDAEVGLSR